MKKKVIYVQEDTCSCGSVCIQSVVSYYGGYIPLETVLDDTSTGPEGTNAYEIVEALKKYGFAAYGERVSLDNLAEEHLPVIAHVVKNGLEHFLVIYEIGETFVTTMDPEIGEKKYPREVFEQIFDEAVIHLYKEGDIPQFAPSSSFGRLLRSIISKNGKYFAIIFALCLTLILLNLLSSFHFKLMSMSEPVKLTVIFAVLQVIVFIISTIKNKVTEMLSKKIDSELTKDIIEHIFGLPIKFLQRKRTGEIIGKIDGFSFIKDLALQLVIANSLDVVLILVSIGISLCISAKLTSIYSVFIIGLVVYAVIINKKIYKRSKDNIRLHRTYTGLLVEYTGGLESIKNLSREKEAIDRLNAQYDSFIHSRSSLSFFAKVTNDFESLLLKMGMLIINCLGFASLSETFTLYDLITLSSLFGLLTSSLKNLLNESFDYFKGKAIYRSTSEFLDIKEDDFKKIEFSTSIESIKIENLYYSYDNFHSNIENLNLFINRGDKIIITGPSGIGKSTFVKCLCGRLNEYRGKIIVDGSHELREFTSSSLRKKIIYVGQEENLFSGTIIDNIAGDDYDEKWLKEVISIAHLEDVIDNRQLGLHSAILEGATNISGGEKARILLARALYRKPEILIIDETLSAISSSMEDEIIAKLSTVSELTLLYITHRQKRHLFEKNITFGKEGNYVIE